MRQDRSAGKPEVHSVTSAGLSHTDDIDLRRRRYVLTQSLRIVCVALAALLPVSLPVKGVFMVGAVILPWFGVVMANAGPTRQRAKGPAPLSVPVAAQPVRIALDASRIIDQD